jgi:hypothetical protein
LAVESRDFSHAEKERTEFYLENIDLLFVPWFFEGRLKLDPFYDNQSKDRDHTFHLYYSGVPC